MYAGWVSSQGVIERVEGRGGRSGGRWFSVVLDDGRGGVESAGERAVRLLRHGQLPVTVTAACGVESQTLRATLKEGAVLAARVAAVEAAVEGGLAPGGEGWPCGPDEWPLSADEWAVLEFARAVTVARAEDEIDRLEAHRRVTMGEATRTITTTKFAVEKDEGGVEVRRPLEVTERVEEVPADPAAMLAMLERLYPDRYAKTDRSQVEVTGTTTVVHVDARELVESIRGRIAKSREALDTTAVEAPVELDPAGSDDLDTEPDTGV